MAFMSGRNLAVNFVALAALAIAPVASRAQSPIAVKKLTSPLTPEQSLVALKVEPGMRVEIAAAEPLVADPIAIAFDERGRMFVAEGRDYPNEPADGQPPEGMIALLEDTDGDGRFDKRTVFVDGLMFPCGILPWR